MLLVSFVQSADPGQEKLKKIQELQRGAGGLIEFTPK